MKKIVLALTMITGLAFANAQTRTIDWSVDAITSPDSLRSTTSGTPITIDATFRNVGPDTAKIGDTILWNFLGTVFNGSNYTVISAGSNFMAYPGVNGNPTTTYSLSVLTKNYAPNDTMKVLRAFSTPLSINQSANIRVFVNAYIMHSPAVASEASSTTANNTKTMDAVWYNQQGWSVGMEKLSIVSNNLNVYPNPAKDMINFDIQSDYATSINITDITGKLVETIAVDTKSVRVNTTEYNNGIYLYQIQGSNGEVLGSGKFNVSK